MGLAISMVTGPCRLCSLSLLGIAWFIASCTQGVVGGNPCLPLSDKNGSTRTLTAPEAEVELAAAGAFANARYRDMDLESSANETGVVPGWKETNGYVLIWLGPSAGITNVPLDRAGKISVPYVAYFHIDFSPVTTNVTKVTVRTIRSEVIDGTEVLNIHGGNAFHFRKVPPVRQEEESVLAAIAEQLPSTTNPRIRGTNR
jgi:hypothetical protein